MTLTNTAFSFINDTTLHILIHKIYVTIQPLETKKLMRHAFM